MHPSALFRLKGKLYLKDLFERDLGKLGTIVHIYTYSGATSFVLGEKELHLQVEFVEHLS